MTKLRTRALAAFGLIASFTPLCLRAEGYSQFKIPFGFTIGQKYLAAGDYRVVQMTQNVLQIRSVSSNQVCNFMVNSAEPDKAASKTVLIFHRYGNEYFFSKMENSDHGWAVLKPAREKELLSARSAPIDLTTVASVKR